MGYNARNDEIRDNITRMRQEWEAQRGALATVRRFNATLSAKGYVWFWPKIAAALTSKHRWLIIACDSCGTVVDLDLSPAIRKRRSALRCAIFNVRAAMGMVARALSRCRSIPRFEASLGIFRPIATEGLLLLRCSNGRHKSVAKNRLSRTTGVNWHGTINFLLTIASESIFVLAMREIKAQAYCITGQGFSLQASVAERPIALPPANREALYAATAPAIFRPHNVVGLHHADCLQVLRSEGAFNPNL